MRRCTDDCSLDSDSAVLRHGLPTPRVVGGGGDGGGDRSGFRRRSSDRTYDLPPRSWCCVIDVSLSATLCLLVHSSAESKMECPKPFLISDASISHSPSRASAVTTPITEVARKHHTFRAGVDTSRGIHRGPLRTIVDVVSYLLASTVNQL